MNDLREKVAFISGGGSGIGLGIARALAAAGMRVALADIDAQALERAVASMRADGATVMPVDLDVRDPAQWRQAAADAQAELGPVQVLCCNAGVAGTHCALEETAPAAWSWTFDVNVNGVFHGIRTFLPELRARNIESHIVVTASLGGFIARPHNGLYSATKAALIALCESLRGELEGSPIGVSVLCPALVRSNLLDNIARLAPPATPHNAVAPELAAALQQGLDPLRVGEDVVRGIRERRFWLFTHPELRALVAQRFDAVLAAMADVAC